MIDDTEQKFLDAALKLFTKVGYTDATTIAIADEAGFSDKTLFRKFKTKKNLYNLVLTRNAEKYKQELDEFVFVDKKFDNHHDFLDNYIRNLAKVNLDNFEYVNLSHHEMNEILEPIMKNAVDSMGEYIEKNIPNSVRSVIRQQLLKPKASSIKEQKTALCYSTRFNLTF
ncbi:MAG: TetR/AcrR family transcriptional regulator [Methanobacterium sp.]